MSSWHSSFDRQDHLKDPLEFIDLEGAKEQVEKALKAVKGKTDKKRVAKKTLSPSVEVKGKKWDPYFYLDN